MDDKIFLGCLIYIVLASSLISFMPDSFFSGSKASVSDVTSIDVDETSGLNFIQKISSFMFVPFIISGIPLIIALFIALLNYFVTTITVIYIYDKIRGIGS